MLQSLSRFHRAQEDTYATVLAELHEGRKRTHWMWFVFPQLAGLGRSETACFYALANLDEARAYLGDPILALRLRECIAAVLQHPDRTAREIFGFPDDMKFQSCLTLFEIVAPDQALFSQAFAVFFGGHRDRETIALALTP